MHMAEMVLSVSGISSSSSISISPMRSFLLMVTSYGGQFSTITLQLLLSSIVTIAGIPVIGVAGKCMFAM